LDVDSAHRKVCSHTRQENLCICKNMFGSFVRLCVGLLSRISRKSVGGGRALVTGPQASSSLWSLLCLEMCAKAKSHNLHGGCTCEVIYLLRNFKENFVILCEGKIRR
jgi:hypothetical protein